MSVNFFDYGVRVVCLCVYASLCLLGLGTKTLRVKQAKLSIKELGKKALKSYSLKAV